MWDRDTKIKLIPSALLIAIVPLIVRTQVVVPDAASRERFGLPNLCGDVFSHAKAELIFLFTALALLSALLYLRKPVLNKACCAAALLYALMIALSAFFSEYRQITFRFL